MQKTVSPREIFHLIVVCALIERIELVHEAHDTVCNRVGAITCRTDQSIVGSLETVLMNGANESPAPMIDQSDRPLIGKFHPEQDV
jgi:hypothetical protein